MVLNDFDSTIYNYVEDFVSKIDYSDDDYSRVTSSELVVVVDRSIRFVRKCMLYNNLSFIFLT